MDLSTILLVVYVSSVAAIVLGAYTAASIRDLDE